MLKLFCFKSVTKTNELKKEVIVVASENNLEPSNIPWERHWSTIDFLHISASLEKCCGCYYVQPWCSYGDKSGVIHIVTQHTWCQWCPCVDYVSICQILFSECVRTKLLWSKSLISHQIFYTGFLSEFFRENIKW